MGNVSKVHITQGDHEGKAVIVSWVTESEPGSSQVNYWTDKNPQKLSAEGNFVTYKYYNYTSGYIHHCTIQDLEASFDTIPLLHKSMLFLPSLLVWNPCSTSLTIGICVQFNTKYYYEVGIGNTTRMLWFTTPPKSGPDVPYTFGLIGTLFSTSCRTLCWPNAYSHK